MNETYAQRAADWMKSADPYHRAICEVALKILEKDRAYYQYGADADDDAVDHPNKGGRLSRAITAITERIVVDFPDQAGNVGRNIRAMVQAMYEVKAQLPRDFYREDDGLICMPGNKAGPKPICSDLRIVAETRHIGDKRNGVVVEVFDHQKGWTEVQYDKRDLYGAGDQWIQAFLDAGLIPESGRNADIKALLVQATSSKIIAVAERPGWASIEGKPVYIAADKVYGLPAAKVRLKNPTRYKIGRKGTLDAWKKTVAVPCQGNSRYMLAVSAAFGSMLLSPFAHEGGGFHYMTESTRGKTTVLQVVASVFGSGDDREGYLQSARTTDNGAELLAYEHNDQCLCLDEIGLVKKGLGDMIYMFANGQDKKRMRANTEGRDRKTWRLFFQTSGELTLSDKIANDDDEDATAGQLVRAIDIPLPKNGQGMYENTHGKTPGRFADDFKAAVLVNYGVAADAFLEAVVRDYDAVIAKKAEIDRIAGELLPDSEADPQIVRAAKRFAVAAIGGELAISFGVLPWEPGTALEAVKQVFDDWVEERGGVASGDALIGARLVLDAIRKHGHSRFQGLDLEGRAVVHNRMGFREEVRAPHGALAGGTLVGYRYWIDPGAFDEIIGKRSRKPILDHLAKQGLLLMEGKRHDRKTPPSLDPDRARRYCVTPAGGDDEPSEVAAAPESGGATPRSPQGATVH